MAVAFHEYPGSPKFNATGDELQATRVGEIAWGDMDALFVELFPVYAWSALMPGSAFLRASGVEFEPIFDQDSITGTASAGVASPINQYELAKATLHYKSIPADKSDPGEFCVTRRWSFGGQYLTLKNTSLKWEDTDEDIVNPDMRGSMFTGIIQHEVSLTHLAAVPWAALRNLVGKVNNAPFEGAATECLLFMGAEVRHSLASDGSDQFEATYRFHERNIDGDATITWNYLFDEKHRKGEWRPVKRAKGGEDLYLNGDFTTLL